MYACDDTNQLSLNSIYKILIIEDTEFINNAVFKTLKEFGYICEQSFDYSDASFKKVILPMLIKHSATYQNVQKKKL